MITIIRCLILACSLVPTLGVAEVYKCKTANGGLRYSDQPCPGTGPTVGQALAARDTTPTPVTPGGASAMGASQATRGGQPPVPIERKPFNPTTQRQLSQHDIEEIKAADHAFKRMNAEIDDRCRAGDSDFCAFRACDALRQGAGPAEDFKRCARGYGRPVGSNWIAHGGEADGMLLPSQVEESRKLSKIYPALSALVCLRPAGSSAQVSGEAYRIDELATLDGGHVFKLSGRYGGSPPEYSSIEALAAAVCGK